MDYISRSKLRMSPEILETYNWLCSISDEVVPTGSFFTVTPSVTTSDVDFAIASKEDVEQKLKKNGFVTSNNEYTGSKFISWRKGFYNVTVHYDDLELSRYTLSTKISHMLNISEKENRVSLFRLVEENGFTY